MAGTGRRGGLKIRFQKWSTGSSPVGGTMKRMTKSDRFRIIEAHLKDLTSHARTIDNKGDSAYLHSKIRAIRSMLKKVNNVTRAR